MENITPSTSGFPYAWDCFGHGITITVEHKDVLYFVDLHHMGIFTSMVITNLDILLHNSKTLVTLEK